MDSFLADLWSNAVMMTPWLLVGATAVGGLHLLMPPNFMSQAFRGWSGVFKAVALGVPLPLCSCAVIPVAVGMHRTGASKASTLGFLISTPQTGADSILVTSALMGWPFALYRVFVSLIMGVFGGGVLAVNESTEPARPTSVTNASRRPSLRDGIEHGWTSLTTIWGWVIIGVIGSAIVTQVGQIEGTSLATLSRLESSLLMLIVALPMYVCATASIPIAAAFVASGVPVEAAFVFLIAGPATNTATIGAIYTALGRKTTIFYLALMVIGSLSAAWGFAWLVPDYQVPELMASHDHQNVLDAVYGWTFALVSILWFRQKFLQNSNSERQQTIPSDTSERRMAVSGMTCQGCVRRLQAALDGDPRTQSAEVSLELASVLFPNGIERADIESVVTSCGFTAEGDSRFEENV